MTEQTFDERRGCAVYDRTIAHLRTTNPGMPDDEMDAQALKTVDASIWGADAKRDRQGNFIEQGIGSKGRESHNHLQAILKYEGREAHAREVARIWKETPDHARELRLAQPART